MSSRYLKIIIPITLVFLAFAGYVVVYAGHILPNVQVGSISVGGLTPEKAVEHLDSSLDQILREGIVLNVEGKSEAIPLENIDFKVSVEDLSRQALEIGRKGSLYERLGAYLSAIVHTHSVQEGISFDHNELRQEIATVARIFDNPGKDVRFLIQGTSVRVLVDTSNGHALDQDEIERRISDALLRLDATPLTFIRYETLPVRNPASAIAAQRQAQQILVAPLVLETDSEVFSISAANIGQWIISETGEQNVLEPGINDESVSTYVTTLASRVNVEAQKAVIQMENGKVIEFKPPRSGMALEEERTVEQIITALKARRTAKPTSPLKLAMKVTKPVSPTIDGPSGIVELIGKATTTFAGSPANRISNIKNGVKFLTGIIIPAGQEFSTIKTLGTIDNTTGYLPELVIKENRTVPEFGGGLCQVSTTLFRSVLNSGLPVTARRNHSYRVSYYEKDALGHFIGPGLDATIYDPDPDFKFKNDTGASILVYGYVKGDTVTFELYGTHDGRVAEVKGPTLLTTIPAGDPIYTETDTLPAGVTKQIETAHAGGTATATYIVKYPAGNVETKEFKSSYRRWPAQYLIGRATGTTPSPSLSPVPTN
jgi:vancomycin resistance protein YoaR